jgi:hypothetical protein
MLPPRTSSTSPRGTLHSFTNLGVDAARALILVTPGGFEWFLPGCRRTRPHRHPSAATGRCRARTRPRGRAPLRRPHPRRDPGNGDVIMTGALTPHDLTQRVFRTVDARPTAGVRRVLRHRRHAGVLQRGSSGRPRSHHRSQRGALRDDRGPTPPIHPPDHLPDRGDGRMIRNDHDVRPARLRRLVIGSDWGGSATAPDREGLSARRARSGPPVRRLGLPGDPEHDRCAPLGRSDRCGVAPPRSPRSAMPQRAARARGCGP